MPLRGLELLLLQQQRLDVAVQRGERRAQVVRDVGDHLAALGIVSLQGLHLLLDAIGHAVEAASQQVDLVTTTPGFRVAQVLPASGKTLHERRETPQPAGDQRHPAQAQEERHHQGTGQEPEGGLQHVAAREPLHHAVVLLSSPDHVQISPELAPAADRCRGKDLGAIRGAGIVAPQWQLRPALQEALDGRQRNPLALHLALRRREGQQPSRAVEQVDLDGRVDHHEHVEQLLQRRAVDSAVHQQGLALHQLAGEIQVQLLHHLLLVTRRGVVGEQQEHRTHHQQQQEQQQGHLAVEGVEQAHSSSLPEANR